MEIVGEDISKKERGRGNEMSRRGGRQMTLREREKSRDSEGASFKLTTAKHMRAVRRQRRVQV